MRISFFFFRSIDAVVDLHFLLLTFFADGSSCSFRMTLALHEEPRSKKRRNEEALQTVVEKRFRKEKTKTGRGNKKKGESKNSQNKPTKMMNLKWQKKESRKIKTDKMKR